MSTPSIYTMGQLKALLVGKVAANNACIAESDSSTVKTIFATRAKAFQEVIALIEGIEAHEAAQPKRMTFPAALSNDDIMQAQGIQGAAARMAAGESPLDVAMSQGPAVAAALAPRTADMDAVAQATGGSNGEA